MLPPFLARRPTNLYSRSLRHSAFRAICARSETNLTSTTNLLISNSSSLSITTLTMSMFVAYRHQLPMNLSRSYAVCRCQGCLLGRKVVADARICLRYGKITSSKAIIDQKTGECKGYGFTMYENVEDCHRAIEGLNKAGLQASFARVGQVRKIFTPTLR